MTRAGGKRICVNQIYFERRETVFKNIINLNKVFRSIFLQKKKQTGVRVR